MMKIDISKKYRTRNGREVKFLHRAPEGWPGAFPWSGVVGELFLTWTDEGREYSGSQESKFDLIEVREPLEISVVMTGLGIPVSIGKGVRGWDHAYPENAPHRVVTFVEKIPTPETP